MDLVLILLSNVVRVCQLINFSYFFAGVRCTGTLIIVAAASPLTVLGGYLVFVFGLAVLIWLHGWEFLAVLLVRVVVGRLAVYFLTTVRVYFGAERAGVARQFSWVEVCVLELLFLAGIICAVVCFDNLFLGGLEFCGSERAHFGPEFVVFLLEGFVDTYILLVGMVMAGLLGVRGVRSAAVLERVKAKTFQINGLRVFDV